MLKVVVNNNRKYRSLFASSSLITEFVNVDVAAAPVVVACSVLVGLSTQLWWGILSFFATIALSLHAPRRALSEIIFIMFSYSSSFE